jgi:hypothetical protein
MKKEGVFVPKGDEKAIKPKSFNSDFGFLFWLKRCMRLQFSEE